jgi:hypothetical protein
LVLPNHHHTLKMGTELSPKRRKFFTSWRGCLPEIISLNSVAAKASRLKCLHHASLNVSPSLIILHLSTLVFVMSNIPRPGLTFDLLTVIRCSYRYYLSIPLSPKGAHVWNLFVFVFCVRSFLSFHLDRFVLMIELWHFLRQNSLSFL